MDYYKIKLISLIVLLSVVKWFLALFGGFGVFLNIFAIGYTCYMYNTDPMHNCSITTTKIELMVGSETKHLEGNIEARCDNWDATVNDTLNYVGYVLKWSTICVAAVLCHFELLKIRDHYQKYIVKHRSQDCKVKRALV